MTATSTLTGGSLFRKFAPLAIPLILQSIFAALVGATDAIMLGMLNQSSLTAVTLATQIPSIFAMFISSLCTGGTVLIAQYFGDKDYNGVRKVMNITLQISLISGTLICLVCILAPETLIGIYTADPELQKIGADYIRMVGPSLLFMSFSQVYMNVMKNTGMARASSIFGFITVFLNIGLNYIFIFGAFGIKGMGAAGAALSTSICFLAEAILTGIMSRRNKYAPVHIKDLFRSYRPMMRKYFRYTLPNVVQGTSWMVASSLCVAIIGHQGNDLVSASSVCIIVMNIVSGFITGYASASGIITGQMLGRKELADAKRAGGFLIRWCLIYGIIIGIIVVLLTPAICGLYTGLTDEAQHLLKIMLWFAGFRCIGKFINAFLAIGLFSAGGDIIYLAKLDIINMWGIVLPLGVLAAYVFKLPPIVVYIVLNLDEYYKLYFMIARYRKYDWVKNLTRKEWGLVSRFEDSIRKQTFERMNSGFLFIGSSGRISMANPACAALLGKEVDDINGSMYMDIFIRSMETEHDAAGYELSDLILEAVSNKTEPVNRVITLMSGGVPKRIRVCTSFIEEEDYKIGVFVMLNEA
ncbi:MAG: MATE family efflux transporter [Parasporobacterium sp.]|nr:MATE family efflux transporter [Parasporobacterium sp.]